jgi:hypothetical protein
VSAHKNRDETYRNEDQGDADSLSSEQYRAIATPFGLLKPKAEP